MGEYLRRHGFSRNELIGEELEILISRGAPPYLVSKSQNVDIRSFVSACTCPDVHKVGDLHVRQQPSTNKDGSIYWSVSYLALVKLRSKPYILVGQRSTDYVDENQLPLT